MYLGQAAIPCPCKAGKSCSCKRVSPRSRIPADARSRIAQQALQRANPRAQLGFIDALLPVAADVIGGMFGSDDGNVGAPGGSGGMMMPQPQPITVSPQISTQVSPQISPQFIQQFQPSGSPVTAGAAMTGAPVGGSPSAPVGAPIMPASFPPGIPEGFAESQQRTAMLQQYLPYILAGGAGLIGLALWLRSRSTRTV